MLGNNILMGTAGWTRGRRRLFLFDREALVTCFRDTTHEEITSELFTLGTSGIFLTKVLKSVIGQISYVPNRDGKTWRVTSVSVSTKGYGTELYKLAMSDIYPQYLTSDNTITDVGEGPRRIWEKISCLSGVESIPREDLDQSWVDAPQYMLYGYRILLEGVVEEVNLIRPNKYTVRFWEETDNKTGFISHFFNELGFVHFSKLYNDF
jgi:hypothetical protein